MNPHISISKCKVRGKQFWRVRWHDAGIVKRKFFSSREAAAVHATDLRGQAVGARELLAALPQSEQEKLVMLYNEAKRRNADLLAFLLVQTPPASETRSARRVLDEMEVAKRKAGRSERYLTGLRWVLDKFIEGREVHSIEQFGLPDVERFLDSKDIAYRATLRARLSTLFKFAIRRGYRNDNPCMRLEPLTIARKNPSIFTVKQVKTALEWFAEHPRALAWFVLSAFAGLRPEEAQNTTWADIHFDEGWIKVEAQTTKIRQRRVVYPLPAAMTWLKRAKKLKSTLPLRAQPLKRERDKFRAALGFKKWPKDITRHSASSYWLALTGEAAKIATMLGHSEKTMRKNYLALVTKAEAEQFWAILPAPVAKPRRARAARPSRPDTASVAPD